MPPVVVSDNAIGELMHILPAPLMGNTAGVVLTVSVAAVDVAEPDVLVATI